MSADLTKRIVVRVTDEQLAWIAEMANDEGMDNATFVRVILDRMSKGRPPLLAMMIGQPQQQVFVVPQREQLYAVPQADGEAGDVLAQRAAEAEAAIPEATDEVQEEEQAAIPLRRAPRGTMWNPGRS